MLFLTKWLFTEQQLLSTSASLYVFCPCRCLLHLFAACSFTPWPTIVSKGQILVHQWVLLRSACVDLLSAGPHGSVASRIIGNKGTRDIFPLSEGFVVVPLKFTSTRMFNWGSAFAQVSTKAEQVSMCHLQTVTACLMLICTGVTVFGSLGIPVAGPIRPRGSAGAASISRQQWWATDDWRGRALQARCNLPNHSHHTPLSYGHCRAKAHAHQGPAISFLQTSVLSLPSWSACVARVLPVSLGSCHGEVCPNETGYQANGDTWTVMNFSLHYFWNMQIVWLNSVCCLPRIHPTKHQALNTKRHVDKQACKSVWSILTNVFQPSPPCRLSVFLRLLSGWRRGGGGPASEPVLARVQPQEIHLPLNHPHRSAPVAHAARRQENGVWAWAHPTHNNSKQECHHFFLCIDSVFVIFTLCSLLFSVFQSSKKFFPITFLGAICWIACFSYLMVWWAHQVYIHFNKGSFPPCDVTL